MNPMEAMPAPTGYTVQAGKCIFVGGGGVHQFLFDLPSPQPPQQPPFPSCLVSRCNVTGSSAKFPIASWPICSAYGTLLCSSLVAPTPPPL
jgi:hypothetical protein